MSSYFKEKFNSLVNSSNKILITSHIGPDYDAIGSVLSINYYISKVLNKNATMAFSGSMPVEFSYV